MLEICYHIYNALLMFLFYVSPSLSSNKVGTGMQTHSGTSCNFSFGLTLKQWAWDNSHTDSDSFKCFGMATIPTTTGIEPSRVMPHWSLNLSRTEQLKQLTKHPTFLQFNSGSHFPFTEKFFENVLCDMNRFKVFPRFSGKKTVWQTLLSTLGSVSLWSFTFSSWLYGLRILFTPRGHCDLYQANRKRRDRKNAGYRCLMSNQAVSAVFNSLCSWWWVASIVSSV